jgi:hypothetical protein
VSSTCSGISPKDAPAETSLIDWSSPGARSSTMILRKLGVSSRSEAVTESRRRRLLHGFDSPR